MSAMFSKTWWTGAGLLTCALLASAPAKAFDRFQFNLVLDGRLVTTPPSTSFLDGGFGKTRYGDQPRTVQARLAQAAFLGRFDARPNLTFRAHANVDAEHNFHRRVDLVEALARFAPSISDTVSADVRLGLFFPTVSLENTDPGWLSPYSTSFSAINAWIGEEVRSLGVEAGPTIRLNEAQLRLFGAYTRGNDPNGSLLAWRGFAVHDRVSGFADRLPLPALRSFDRRGLFPEQPAHVQPMREVDQKWTWSTGASLTHDRYRAKILYQPKTASPGAFDGLQYAWRTGYWSAGAARSFGPVEFLAQGLRGETRMGVLPTGENAVVAEFEAVYLLASWLQPAANRHRATVRYDAFRVRDRDQFPTEDANDESGTAWTFAYSFAPTERGRLTLEILRVNSTRSNRRDLGFDPRSIEVVGTLSLRLTF